jgi:DNA-binding MarR family transcriptional regulator
MSGPASFPSVDAGQDAWKLMIQLFHSHRRAFATIASEAELGPSQLQLLMNIKPERAAPMSELAEALYCDASYITSLVDKLEARNLLERRPSPGDRRVKLIALTPDGHALRAKLLERVFQPPPAIAGLPKADREALREILSRALADQPCPPNC